MQTQPDYWLAPSFRDHLWSQYRRGTCSPVRPAEWLYPLKGDLVDFRSGCCPNGEQVLIGQYFPSVVACFFSPAGELLRVEDRPLTAAPQGPDPERDAVYREALRQGAKGPPADPQFMLEAVLWLGSPTRDGERLVHRWMQELGFTPGTVQVQRFHLPDRRIGIEDGNQLDEDGILEDWQGWLQSGSFVFWWSRDLWVDGEGRVVAT